MTKVTSVLGWLIKTSPQNGFGAYFTFASHEFHDIADLLLDARSKLGLDQEELAMARQAEKLVIEFAKIGVNALVDETTEHIGDDVSIHNS